jgi:hypothetical protein
MMCLLLAGIGQPVAMELYRIAPWLGRAPPRRGIAPPTVAALPRQETRRILCKYANPLRGFSNA